MNIDEKLVERIEDALLDASTLVQPSEERWRLLDVLVELRLAMEVEDEKTE